METPIKSSIKSQPAFLDKSSQLVSVLKKMKAPELSQLMGISPKLGQLNFDRYQEWVTPYIIEKTRQAIFAFKGDVYTGLNIDIFKEEDLTHTQRHLRILSGLYGVLRPMDSILAYRLEMGTKLKYRSKNNLYEFWGDIITISLQNAIDEQGDDILINLASNEYFKSINTKKLKARIVTPIFKDFKNGEYKFMSFYGKKARGMMARYILLNQINNIDDLKLFEEDGYFYNDKFSKNDELVFTRG